ncbi:MAG: FAD-binding oxidoreductase [Vulcanimicrobiaceae bacterium]
MERATFERLHSRLREVLGAGAVRCAPEDLAVFSADAYGENGQADLVVFPETAREVAAIVRIAGDCGVPVVARGAGTGLCGAAVPVAGGIVLSSARMNRIRSLDLRRRRAIVEPGLINAELSRACTGGGLFFGPDPSSGAISTLGGNAATNAGGPHAFAYGSMSAHVLGIEFVDAAGELVTASCDDSGYDLTGLLVGSEGTLGITTALELRLLRIPPAVRVFVAAFGAIEAASETVSAIVAAGIAASALEIMDATIVRAIEAHYHAGYPDDAAAVLLVEVAGEAEDVAEAERAIRTLAHAGGALSWQAAADAAQRAALWASRKGAAGALGRFAPNYYIQDVTVPRTRLPEAVAGACESARSHGLVVGNVFHAGDGNLHPLLVFDRRERAQVEAVIAAGNEILARAIALGGTVSGEHGIGYEKRDAMTQVFSSADLAAMARVRELLDPARTFNPDKIFPRGAVCGEVLAAQPALAAGVWT